MDIRKFMNETRTKNKHKGSPMPRHKRGNSDKYTKEYIDQELKAVTEEIFGLLVDKFGDDFEGMLLKVKNLAENVSEATGITNKSILEDVLIDLYNGGKNSKFDSYIYDLRDEIYETIKNGFKSEPDDMMFLGPLIRKESIEMEFRIMYLNLENFLNKLKEL